MDILGFISTGHLLLTEAYLCMLAKVAGRLGITGDQVTTNKMPISLPFAVLGVALKHMNMVPLDILNQSSGLEEHIDG